MRLVQLSAMVACAAAAFLGMATPTQAQQSEASIRSLHVAAHNRLGLLQYCQARGLASAEAVDAQHDSLARLPPVTEAELGAPEEAEGRLGYLAFGGRQGAFADSVAAQGTSLKWACEDMAAIARLHANR